jgi:hypothetical protein
MPSVCAGYHAAGDKLGDPPHHPEERFRPDGWCATCDEYLQDPDGIYLAYVGAILLVAGVLVLGIA